MLHEEAKILCDFVADVRVAAWKAVAPKNHRGFVSFTWAVPPRAGLRGVRGCGQVC